MVRSVIKILHLYDGHERVFPGEGSVPSAVYYLAKYTARLGHEVTVLERRWVGTEKEEKTPDGVTFIRFDLKISSNVSNREVVAREVKKPTGLLKLIPSLEEGFPVAVTEALATGKPVIGSKTGGIPMQIIEGHNGFLIEPGDFK